jgi:hypothetical protein
MVNQTSDDATTWRDLADALTPHQIAYLENWESRPDLPPRADGSARPSAQHERALLFTAREYSGQNAAAALYADIAPPPEVGQHYPWEHFGDGTWTRFFVGTTRKVGSAEVMITGLQSSDGSIERSIGVDGASDSLDASNARTLAAALLEAADELDRLAAL